MAKITAIKPQKRKGRYNVFIDEKFALGIDEDTLVKEGLVVGKEISELERQELEEKSEVGKLYQKALHFLEYRPRSEREIRDYLKRKLATTETLKNTEDTEVIIERILNRLKSLNYLNDSEFAKWWVEQRRKSRKPRGINLIRSELYQKGVAREIIEKTIITKDNEEELALRTAQSKLKQPNLPNLPIRQLANPKQSWELRRKLTAYLARRGFEWETIKMTVDKVLPKK